MKQATDLRDGFMAWRNRIPNFETLYNEHTAWIAWQAAKKESPAMGAKSEEHFLELVRYAGLVVGDHPKGWERLIRYLKDNDSEK